MFQNRVLRKIVGHERKKVQEDWRKLHNEELQNRVLRKIVGHERKKVTRLEKTA